MINRAREFLNPPYSLRNLISIFLILLLLVTIPLVVIELQKQRSSKALAKEADITNPSVQIGAPPEDASVKGNTKVTVRAQDTESPIRKVEVYINKDLRFSAVNPLNTTNFTYTFFWDTIKEKQGTYMLSAKAQDSSGNLGSAMSTSVIVTNPTDNKKPTVAIETPRDGDFLAGTAALVSIKATDNTLVSRVDLTVDGLLVKSFLSAPYKYSLDLSKINTGTHILSARASDTSGNTNAASVSFYKGLSNLDLSP